MKLNFLLILTPLLMAMHCAEESEKDQFNKGNRLEDYRYDGHAVTKEAAIRDWVKFLKESEDMIAYSRCNLEELYYHIEEAPGTTKFVLLRQYEDLKKAIEKLESERQRKNDSFNSELDHYNLKSQRKNTAFIRHFRREIIRINLALKSTLENRLEMFSE